MMVFIFIFFSFSQSLVNGEDVVAGYYAAFVVNHGVKFIGVPKVEICRKILFSTNLFCFKTSFPLSSETTANLFCAIYCVRDETCKGFTVEGIINF